jgi:hypothetical protein
MASFDERAFIARVESANVDEFIHLLLRPTAPEEQALRAHLGDERFQRLHGRALKHVARRDVAPPRGNVVVIPGMLGSALTAFDRTGSGVPVWVNVPGLTAGALGRLRLADDGLAEADATYEVRATGILKRNYGDLLLALAEEWNVRAFWYDWRKDSKLAAAELEARLNGWFLDDTPTHLVAHGMGGLVARAFILNAPERWAAMWDRQSAAPGTRGGRQLLLGVPQHGSFIIPQTLLGNAGIARKLALLDSRRDPADLLAILHTFPGLYQLLPSPLVMPRMHRLYETATYGRLAVSQRHLENARRQHQALSGVLDPARMVSVLGTGQPTFSDILAWTQLGTDAAYAMTNLGDGVVPRRLGLLGRPAGARAPAYYVEDEHGALVANGKVLAAINDLLGSGTTTGLSQQPQLHRARNGHSGTSTEREDAASKERARRRFVTLQAGDERLFSARMHRLRVRSGAASGGNYVTPEERQLAESLTRGFLSGAVAQAVRARGVPFAPARIEIGLLHGDIEKLHALDAAGLPADAVAVGHYIGVKPRTAALALDRAISRALRGKAAPRRSAESAEAGAEAADDLLLTHYTERGIIRGELGQPFCLPDPRRSRAGADGVIAVAGMGLPGRFGEPELTVLARELCWSLGRLGKRHLATVLIGAGKGNLPVRDAVSAWIRGIKHAITGTTADGPRRLRRITFVERDPLRVEAIQEAILYEAQRLNAENRLHVVYEPLNAAELQRLRAAGRQWLRREWEREWVRRQEGQGDPDAQEPTRVTVGLGPRIYRFGAITETASIPEREIPLDPALVMRANDELAAEWDPALQLERGQFLARLLVPDDLRTQLHTSAPLVLVLDAASARIHWELLARSDLISAISQPGDDRITGDGRDYFLGTSRGFTRQLRTTFAPPPEAPPPPQRLLRVLIIADPAEDAPLPGAEAEGVEVAALFECFNTVYEETSVNRVEVVRLFGPREATRTNVLRHLILRSYDVLHFAGHCVYDPQDPAASGWIFTGGERLSANELRRVDRIPKFVFSNACESGITPDRSQERSVDLAPSFAESFFARGVSNFVCTAWPVDDVAAREFALRLYAGLLGLALVDGQGSRYEAVEAEPMHVAMRQARLAIADTPGGARTWGAYQHYGNPYLRFFAPTPLRRPRPQPTVAKAPAEAAGTGTPG